MKKPAPPTNQDSLDERILGLKSKLAGTVPAKTSAVAGMRLGVEFLSGVVAGSLAGYIIDHFFTPKPLGFIIGFFLGIAAGLVNIQRSMKKL